MDITKKPPNAAVIKYRTPLNGLIDDQDCGSIQNIMSMMSSTADSGYIHMMNDEGQWTDRTA